MSKAAANSRWGIRFVERLKHLCIVLLRASATNGFGDPHISPRRLSEDNFNRDKEAMIEDYRHESFNTIGVYAVYEAIQAGILITWYVTLGCIPISRELHKYASSLF